MEIMEMISTIGFPILACLYVFNESSKHTDKLYENMAEMNKSQQEISKTLAEISVRLANLEK